MNVTGLETTTKTKSSRKSDEQRDRKKEDVESATYAGVKADACLD